MVFAQLTGRESFRDIENQRYFVFLTNNLEVDALTIVKLYKLVRQVSVTALCAIAG